MLYFVKLDISCAISVSLIRDSAACRFSAVVFRFLTVAEKQAFKELVCFG
jgi:hypothetical protein